MLKRLKDELTINCSSTGAAPESGDVTVLVADDTSFVRDLIRTVLEASGYRVIEAVDGEEAIKKFTENEKSIDFLVLDILMPKKNGKEVYDEIIRMRPDIGILFMSGYHGNAIDMNSIKRQGLSFIEKPFLPSELLCMVKKIVGQGNGQKALVK